MIKIDKNKIQLWSNIGSRATFGLSCLEIIKENKNIMIVTADVSTSAGLDRFKKNYPNNYVDVGIAEQNMIGVAAGLASEGYDVITTTFSPFQTLRCLEQIKVNLGYMENKITMVGLASGLVLGNLGYTHCSIEDIGVLRSIPNIQIISPADCTETVKALEGAILSKKSSYIRLTGGSNTTPIYENNYKFKIGEAIELKKGKKILIISNGMLVKTALEVSDYFNRHGLEIGVVNMHTVKPLDIKYLKKNLENYSVFFSIEEHNTIGGLGSALAEFFSNQKNCKLIRLGINDRYTKSGSYNYLMKLFKLDKKSIIKIMQNEIKNI